MNDRYGWIRGEPRGYAGEIPNIRLDEKDELPPIGKAHNIEVSYIKRDEIEESDLFIFWIVGEEKIFLRTKCQLNDPRLKEQFKKNPDFADKIISAFVRWSLQLYPEKKKEFAINEILAESELPESLQPFVKQVKIWKFFVEQFDGHMVVNQRYAADVTQDGYYQFVTHSHSFKTWMESEEIDFDREYYAVFDFNPEKQPPEIDEDCIFWKLPEKKIMIILPHSGATEEVAKYYGYPDVYKQYVQEKKEKMEKEKAWADERTKKIRKAKSEEEQQARNKLRSLLLS